MIRNKAEFQAELERLSEGPNPDGTVDIAKEIWNHIVDALSEDKLPKYEEEEFEYDCG